MAIEINKDKLLLEQDYLSMTAGLEKIFLKKFKKSKKHLAENDKKFTEEEIEDYKAGRLLSWDLFMKPENKQ
jgi:hypothetical protein